jgi:hypothetical protein
MMTRRLLALLLVSVLCSNGTAWADADNDALIESGLRLRREHRDAEALDQFQRAQQAHPSPRAQAQIGFAEQALGRWLEAETDLSAALETRDDAWIVAHAGAVNTALGAIRQHLGSLIVDSNVGGAELWMKGEKAATLPTDPVRLVAGKVDVEVRASGYASVRRTLEVPAGGSIAAHFEFAAAPPPVPPSVTPKPAEPAATQPTSSAPSTRRVLAWGTLGAAGALLGAGVGAQIVREVNAQRYNDDALCLYGDLSRDQRCGGDRVRADSAQVFANVAYVSAGAFAVASLALFLEPSHPTKSGNVNFWFDARASSMQIGCGGDF